MTTQADRFVAGPGAARPRPRPVFARHAASLLVVRHAVAGAEVLMGVRGAGHRFMPNRLVFPGGAVDPADKTAAVGAPLRPDVIAMLRRSATPRLAHGIAAAAARELEEETGLTLGAPPRLDRMDYLCRAVTPPQSPIRFNARFLIVPADAVIGTPQDTHELHDVRFYPVTDVLDLDIVLVTRAVLERLATYLDTTPAAWRARTGVDVFKLRNWQTE